MVVRLCRPCRPVRVVLVGLWLAGWLGGGVAWAAPSAGDTAYRIARTLMAQERPAQALRQAERCLEVTGGAEACRLVRAQALSAMGRCDRALTDLVRLRGRAVWGWRDAVAEARCRFVRGERAAAEAALDDADRLPGGRWGVPGAAVAMRLDAGDLKGAEAAWGTLPDSVARARLGLRIAVARGGRVADGALAEADAGALDDGGWRTTLVCQRRLDAGDAWAAWHGFEGGRGTGEAWLRGLACRAEAARRLGSPEAVSEVGPDGVIPVDAWWWKALRVRAAVDQGDLVAAASWLPPHPLDAGPEAVASAWYLARARADAAGMAAAQARWATVGHDRRLEDLVPLTAPRTAP